MPKRKNNQGSKIGQIRNIIAIFTILFVMGLIFEADPASAIADLGCKPGDGETIRSITFMYPYQGTVYEYGYGIIGNDNQVDIRRAATSIKGFESGPNIDRNHTLYGGTPNGNVFTSNNGIETVFPGVIYDHSGPNLISFRDGNHVTIRWNQTDCFYIDADWVRFPLG